MVYHDAEHQQGEFLRPSGSHLLELPSRTRSPPPRSLKPSTTGSTELDDVLTQMPNQPDADVIVNKYIQAIGGAEKLAALKSYVEIGTSIGFGGFGGGGEVHIYAKSPDERATHIEFKAETGRGEVWRTYGRPPRLDQVASHRAPRIRADRRRAGRRQNRRADELSRPDHDQGADQFARQPAHHHQRSSRPVGPDHQRSRRRRYRAGPLGVRVQGSGANGSLATLYFDHTSNLLLRMVRYAKSPIGRIPTQVDYTDYRDAGGILMPHHLTFAWLRRPDAIQINKIETNIPIDAAIFGKPPSK